MATTRPFAMSWARELCPEGCACHKQSSGLEQSLGELEFMRSASSAAQAGDVRKLEQLVTDAPHRLGSSDGTGYTPLHYAARGGHSECVGLLLRHRACVDARTSGGATPLHRAAFTGQASVCTLLLRANASVSAQDSDGDTPLHKAAAQQHEATVRILLNVRHAQPHSASSTPPEAHPRRALDAATGVLQRLRAARPPRTTCRRAGTRRGRAQTIGLRWNRMTSRLPGAVRRAGRRRRAAVPTRGVVEVETMRSSSLRMQMGGFALDSPPALYTGATSSSRLPSTRARGRAAAHVWRPATVYRYRYR